MQALRQNKRRSRVSKTKSFAPPTKGWISRANIENGIPGTALILDNFFPLADAIKLREGFAEHSDTGESANDVESLLVHHGTSGTNKIFAASNATIYDVTGTASSSITSLTNARWRGVNFATSGGHYLWICNGADAPRAFDGSSWSTPTINAAPDSTAGTDLIDVNEYKSRLYFVVDGTLKFAYLPTESIAGTLATSNLGTVFSKGGSLLTIGTLTRDGGAGPDDYIVFLTTEGQAAIYQGSDPSDANDWSLTGVYNLPRPIGRRCMFKVGGDLYIITEAGVIPLTKATSLAEATAGAVAVTNNIDQAMTDAADRYKTNFGWEISEYSQGTMAIVNIPVSANTSYQYVMNTQTGAWCRFTGITSKCWAQMGGVLYFGGKSGKVYKFGENASDDGTPIVGDMQTHFDAFGNHTLIKDWKMIRAVIKSDGTTSPAIRMNVDFSNDPPTEGLTAVATTGALWGSATWGSFTWTSTQSISREWRNLTDNPGYMAAVRIRASASGTGTPVLMQFYGVDVVYEPGAIL